MRRRFLGQKHSSKNGSSSNNKRPSVDISSNRRSFVAEGTTLAKAEESNCALMAENKYATIGRFAKKWPWECYRPTNPATAPLPVEDKCRPRQDGEALNGDGLRRRPQSMAKTNGRGEAQTDGIAFTAAGPSAGGRMMMNESAHCLQQENAHSIAPIALFHSTSVGGGNNRNSTGSTNSSQASSGFESAKSSGSSHHLATSNSSGSCSSGVASSSTAVVHLHHSSALPLNASPEAGPASSSSRLSSAGSSTQCRSSAYFSLSDGLDSSLGPGGTLTVQKRAKEPCPRVNITEMLARGIPEAEIFAEWLQRLCLSEYLALFLGQGYDLQTLARASPEDLTTLGITRPEDRKRLFQDIQTWRNLKDNWPTNLAMDANVSDWLNAIGLKQYMELFEQQGYLSVGGLEQLEPEDLEDIGVKKLGHIKRICLALKKLRSFRADSADPSAAAICPTLCAPSCSLSLHSSNIHAAASSASSAESPHFVQAPIIKRQHSQAQHPQMDNNSRPAAQQASTAANCDKNCQRVSFNGIATDGTRMRKSRENGGRQQSVQFRNLSFVNSLDGQTATDKGPPRLNLYRTSQIIAQLPREPPPEFDGGEEEWTDEKGTTHCRQGGHRGPPPPPAPTPFSPMDLLDLASSSSTSSASSSSYLRLFCSQPNTPRHNHQQQKIFPHQQQRMMEDEQHQCHHFHQQNVLPPPAEMPMIAPTARMERRRMAAETERLTNLVSKR